MLNLTSRRPAFGVVAAMIASPALLAGCGGDRGDSGIGIAIPSRTVRSLADRRIGSAP
jgi:hypothetical protein